MLDSINSNLLFINPQTNRVEKTLSIDSGPTDMHMDYSGDTLYIAANETNQIVVIDLVTQEKVRSILVTFPPYSIATIADGYIICSSNDSGRSSLLISTSIMLVSKTIYVGVL